MPFFYMRFLFYAPRIIIKNECILFPRLFCELTLGTVDLYLLRVAHLIAEIYCQLCSVWMSWIGFVNLKLADTFGKPGKLLNYTSKLFIYVYFIWFYWWKKRSYLFSRCWKFKFSISLGGKKKMFCEQFYM